MTPQTPEDYDRYLTNLVTPMGAPKIDSPKAQNTLPGDLQLPDDLLSIPSCADDDLISVLFRDIQPSNFGSLIGDVPSICDFLDSEFDPEFNALHIPNPGEKEIIAPVQSTTTAATAADDNSTGCSSQLVYQLPEAAYDGTEFAATIQIAVSDDAVGHQAQRSQFYPDISVAGRMERGLAGTSVPTEPPRHREISPPLSRPQTRRSNQRAVNLRSASHLSSCVNAKSELPSCPDYNRISTLRNADTGGMGAQSLTNMHEECVSIDEHLLSPTSERIHLPYTLASKPRIWLKPRLIKTPVGGEVADATDLLSHPQPIEYHLRPIRGRPRGSKTGGGKRNVSSITSVVSDVTQLSASSSQATPPDSTTEKPKKTRAKHKKVVQPNPYPDLSKYRSSGEQSTYADDAAPHSPTTSTNGANSAVDATFMHSIGSPPTAHYPLPVSDASDPASFVLTNAEWDNVSRPSSTRSHTQPNCHDKNDDRTLRPPDETAVTDRSQIYPASTSPVVSSTSSTGSTGASGPRMKRKRDVDDIELYEMGSSLNRRRRVVNTPSSSPSELCNRRAGAISSTPARKIYEYANTSGEGHISLADTYRNTGGFLKTTGNATLSPVFKDSNA